jgi:hypothetical protein
MRLWGVVTVALISGLLVAPGAHSPATAAECPAVTPYPGDAAPKADIAGWMARGAAARGIPGELPVMAALVESGLVNLTAGDADAKGYFQMREAIWNAAYPGFATNPELQLDWFLDQAAKVRTPPYPAETSWGEWAADVELPAAQYRYRYQLRLVEARSLIGTPCTPPPDTVAPLTRVTAAEKQKALKRHGIEVSVTCPTEPCTAGVRVVLRLGPKPELAAAPATLAPAQEVTLEVRFRRSVRRLVARALDRHRRVRADLTVTTVDAAGNTSETSQRVRITG